MGHGTEEHMVLEGNLEALTKVVRGLSNCITLQRVAWGISTAHPCRPQYLQEPCPVLPSLLGPALTAGM